MIDHAKRLHPRRVEDCPCHGSRFGLDGRVIHGPAVKPLERKALTPSPRREAGRAG